MNADQPAQGTGRKAHKDETIHSGRSKDGTQGHTAPEAELQSLRNVSLGGPTFKRPDLPQLVCSQPSCWKTANPLLHEGNE